MGIAHQQCHTDDQHGGDQRAHNRDELHGSARGSEYKGVRHAQHAQKCRVHHQRQCRERELSTNKVGEHLIQIIQDALEELALGPRLHDGKSCFTETAPILQKEYRQYRHQYQKPDILGCLSQS